MSDNSPVVELRGIGKTYGETTVLANVDLALRSGEVHGLIGRNGAGKSTLVGILTGRHLPSTGSILVGGTERTLDSPARAASLGIRAVTQELVLPMQMTVQEAVTLGFEPNTWGFINRRSERRRVREVLDSLGIDIDTGAAVSSLPVSWQKIVLVAQLLYRGARVIAFDEPTSAMNPEDAERVLQLIEDLRSHDVAILYISHRLEEVVRLCDNVTVLRDGERLATLGREEFDKEMLVGMMLQADGSDTHSTQDATALRDVAEPLSALGGRDHLCAHGVTDGFLKNFSIDVAPGEVVGIAGLPGSGVETAFAVLSGQRRPSVGVVRRGTDTFGSVRKAVRLGVASLPASRRDVILDHEPVPENMALGALGSSSRFSFVSAGMIRRFCQPVADLLGLTPVFSQRIGQLSGGNQQRALVGGRVLSEPHFLVLEDPTVGVDISARQDLHDVLRNLASRGMGIVVGSSDPSELVVLCQRVLVIRRGEMTAELSGADLTEYELTRAVTGASADAIV
ncbi:MAG: rbsA 1 [Subtercola sp.]|nr:rbsA 1 [Subtercola sp.]